MLQKSGLFYRWGERYSLQYCRNIQFSSLYDHFGLVSPEEAVPGMSEYVHKGRKREAQSYPEKLLRILWVGNVLQAVQYLATLNPVQLRPTNRVAKLCGYFTKHRDHIPCYVLRHLLGLRNSSNRVEPANELVVAQRQKRNGMSWSVCGSAVLAQLKALFINREAFYWLHDHSMQIFAFAAA